MADPVHISGKVEFDGDRVFVGDPVSVQLVVRVPGGPALQGAEVGVALVDLSGDSVADRDNATTDAEGAVRLALTGPSVGVYKVIAHASTSAGTREGYTQIDMLWVREEKPAFTASPGYVPSMDFQDARNSQYHHLG
jgi:hypothetical protein